MLGQKDKRTYAIIGAAMEVHRTLGPGFLEGVYHEALSREFYEMGIPFEREKALSINYKGKHLVCSYKADFVCYTDIIVELKALAALSGVETAQVINYLKATGFHRGLILNFGAFALQTKRLLSGESKLKRPKIEAIC